jgi:sarcosine oxidase subunit beta
VIGGGVAGTSCAYHLARAGTQVLLVERTALAAASSGRSAAFIETQYTEPDQIRMCVHGRRLYDDLHETFGINFQVRGKLLLGRTPEERSSFESSVRLQRELGGDDASILEHDELVTRFPSLAFDRREFALYGPGDGYLDPVALCHAYAHAAVRAGATIQPSSQVDRLDALASGYRVHTDRETLSADALVIAAGAWTQNLAAMVDLPVPISGYRRQVTLLEAPSINTQPLVVDPNTRAGCLYFRDDGPGRVLAGLHSETRSDGATHDPDHYQRSADPEFGSRVRDLTRRRLKGAPALHLLGGWAGLYPITRDGRFVLGESNQRPGVFFCAGLAGNGIQLSAAAGEIVAQLVCDGDQTLLPDLTPYTPDRFL